MFILQLAVIVSIIGFVAYKIQERNSNGLQNQEEKTFPELSGPVTRTYSWEYDGKIYEISTELYKSSYLFYQNSQKSYAYFGDLPGNWQEEYYGMFLRNNPEDKVISSLIQEIKKEGRVQRLDDDQIVELVISFVQSIPYDDSKAVAISMQDENATVRYPYEVLYEKSGVCSEKSLLAIALLRELGYGAAAFIYEQDNHMAIGVQCPKQYSTYGSGYCYAETTMPGHKIGIIPEMDPSKNKAVAVRELGSFGSETDSKTETVKELGSADIYQKTVAREYEGIIRTVEINNEIQQLQKSTTSLRSRLLQMQKEIADLDSQLESMRKKMNKLKDNGDFDEYNDLVSPYNKKVKESEVTIEKYNGLVDQYNKQTARYNILIKQ